MSKEKADLCVEKLKEATVDFPTFVFFCNSNDNGGFCYGNFETGDARFAAGIIDVMRHNEDMLFFFKKIINLVGNERAGVVTEAFKKQGEFKNEILINVDTSRKDSVIISKPTDSPTNIVDDMATLCEGLCTLIHTAEQSGQKPSAQSLRDCINHLEKGFSDPSYIGIDVRTKK